MSGSGGRACVGPEHTHQRGGGRHRRSWTPSTNGLFPGRWKLRDENSRWFQAPSPGKEALAQLGTLEVHRAGPLGRGAGVLHRSRLGCPRLPVPASVPSPPVDGGAGPAGRALGADPGPATSEGSLSQTDNEVNSVATQSQTSQCLRPTTGLPPACCPAQGSPGLPSYQEGNGVSRRVHGPLGFGEPQRMTR